MPIMKTWTKILLTIPSLLTIIYVPLIISFPLEFKWIVPSMKVYHIQLFTLQVLSIIQLIFLIRILWSFKHVEKSKKSEWTWILIVFSSLSCLVFIWSKINEFEKMDRMRGGNNQTGG